MRTAIYIRVSTEEQVTDGYSINAQKDKLTKYAEINDYDIVDYYVDDGISGKNLNERPEVTRLINDVKLGNINNVLVYKLDRLTRSVKDLIYLIELFDKYNCTFNSQTEKIDTSNAVGRMFVKIIGIFAEFERENLAERITLGYEQKTREGNYTNCNGVFGYDYLVGKGKLVVNKEERFYVNKIYEWYLDGKSMLAIAKKLDYLNVPTKRGGRWSSSTINSILNNPLYIGNVRYGVNKKNNFEVVGKDIDKIIDIEIYNGVQKLIMKRKKFNSRNNSSYDTYYLSVLICGCCNSKYSAKIQVKKGKKYITYRCAGCKSSGFSHYKLEDAFLKYVNRNSVSLTLQDNFIKLNNREKKIFLEKYVQEIRVKKDINKVIVERVIFSEYEKI